MNKYIFNGFEIVSDGFRNIGNSIVFNNGQIVSKDEQFNVVENYEEVQVPQTIAPRQCRLQLLSLGLLDEVEALCASDRAMQIWFEYSLDFQRNHEMIIAMALQLGMSEEDMDNFFIEASKL